MDEKLSNKNIYYQKIKNIGYKIKNNKIAG